MAGLSLVFYIGLVVATAVGIVAVSRFLGGKPLTAAKDTPYECGMPPVEMDNAVFPVRFYKTALLFVVFDVEIVFLFLWALVVRDLGWFGLVEIGVFIAILMAAFLFAWWKGDLRWE
ncbi:MAG: NADH-quinone oxidoreductase subunit A [Pseudomonadota bacterium]|nr:NADH-quinone oxidoreductase subunit A [Pseudomonadota bacterium]